MAENNIHSVYEMISLNVDIGGTNANLGIFGFQNGIPKLLFRAHEKTAAIDDFPGLINNFLAQAKAHELKPKVACFAVAGPVDSLDGYQKVNMTNSNLVIDSKNIIEQTQIDETLIINDFEAISYVINALQKEDFITLNSGRLVVNGVRAVIGAGTGLGKNILYYDNRQKMYLPLPSEGGRADLPIVDENEMKLAKFIKKFRNIKALLCYEDVVSGIGLENIYMYLQSTSYQTEPKNLTAEQISETKSDNPCSADTFDWFIKFYARAARNFALDVLARGGVYIAGGIAAKNPDSFKNFFAEFVQNEVYHDLLEKIPVYLITNYDLGLIGSAYALLANGLI